MQIWDLANHYPLSKLDDVCMELCCDSDILFVSARSDIWALILPFTIITFVSKLESK